MSLDVYIAHPLSKPEDMRDLSKPEYEFIVSWEKEGFYWFLYPLMKKLGKATGQMIDLYGDATFAGPHLSNLKSFIEEAQRIVEAHPETWEECLGLQIYPTRQKFMRLSRNGLCKRC